MRENIENILMSIPREGIDSLCVFLASSDFYKAPSSRKFHLNIPGGLVLHSTNVLKCAMQINTKYDSPYGAEHIVIASLCHDLCKVNYYKETDEQPTEPQMRYLKDLARRAGVVIPEKLNKAYAGELISWLLNERSKDVIMPDYVHNYVIEDQLPIGHGEKSLFIVQQFISLTVDEVLAIRWHMGAFDLNQDSYAQKQAYQEAVKKSKLVTIIQLADLEATNLMEA
jgi:hypothetical protein